MGCSIAPSPYLVLGLSPGRPSLVTSSPCVCCFFSLLWFNFSHTGPEWQFGRSNLILNRCKLQGNIWQSTAETDGAGHTRCRQAKGQRAVTRRPMPSCESSPFYPRWEAALYPTGDGGRLQVVVVRR